MKMISCKFNMDTGCVEARYSDGSVLAVDVNEVEDAYNISMAQQADVDYLIYNEPREYLQLVLSGRMENFIKGPTMHGLMD